MLRLTIKEIAAKVADDRGVELVHSEVAGTKRDSVVRIYIDKPDGVTLDDFSPSVNTTS